MPAICFYFQVHQPFRLRHYNFFEMNQVDSYFDDSKNVEILNKVSEKSYLPTNQLLLKLIKKHKGKFKIAFSLSGIVLEQLKNWRPDILASFQALVDTGCVELLAETYHHSLTYLYSKAEFVKQVQEHEKLIHELFGVKPKVFRNTELIYNNDLAHFIENLGYQAILTEGVDNILTYRSPNYLHHPPNSEMPILLKNYKLSDDIAFRFSNKDWAEYPLTADKYAHWIHQIAGNGEVVNLFMDYETFGEHQWADTGIFNFLEHLPESILRHPDFRFLTPSEVVEHFDVKGEYDVPHYISWADTERDLSAWRSNNMQHEALRRLYALEHAVKNSADEQLEHDWRRLTTSDHFYYMCTKYWSDGDVHKYFSPYDSPTEAYNNFVNVCSDIEFRLSKSTYKVPINVEAKQ